VLGRFSPPELITKLLPKVEISLNQQVKWAVLY